MVPATGTGRRLYREHGLREDAADGGCWWFASDGEGRFDLQSPRGTCYFGETEGVAVRERCGRILAMGLPLTEDLYRGRVVSEVKAPAPGRPVADMAHPEALQGGVTGELAATSDHELTQEWARACWAAGFGGIRYTPRFTPGREAALALFGQTEAEPRRGVFGRRDLLEVLIQCNYPTIRADELTADTLDVQDDAEPQ